MIRLSVCIEMIFRELPFVERMKAVKQCQYDAVEFWGWDNKDIDAIDAARKELGLKIASFVVGGPPLVKASSQDEFVAQLRRTVEVCHRLDTQRLIVTTGQELEDVPRAEQHQAIVSNLKAAASIAEDAGVVLCLEPLNILVNHKGYYLSTSKEGFEIIHEVDSPAVKLLYDIYHQQITEGHLIPTITQNIQWIGHFHAADNPGRHEPGTGEINYRNVFRAIDKTGYDGYIGLEYSPSKDPAETLAEVRELAAHATP